MSARLIGSLNTTIGRASCATQIVVHPPTFLLRRHDTVELLESTSTLMGMFEQFDCAIAEPQLYPGDTLVLSLHAPA
jgi:serine phosphatase RsbU (regulator of sigma subunit)